MRDGALVAVPARTGQGEVPGSVTDPQKEAPVFAQERRRRRTVVLALALAATLAPPAAAAPPVGQAVLPACADGVTVVVDFTDLGGEIETGCATEAATGTEALRSAGFTDTRDASGLVCAIEAAPDPCPETFSGSFWSYWHAAPGGAWESYLEGPDTAVPQPGAVEGWRHNDGSTGPSVTPSAADAAGTTATPAPTDGATAVLEAPTDDGARSAPSTGLLAAAVLLALLAVAAALVARHRSRSGGTSDPR